MIGKYLCIRFLDIGIFHNLLEEMKKIKEAQLKSNRLILNLKTTESHITMLTIIYFYKYALLSKLLDSQ